MITVTSSHLLSTKDTTWFRAFWIIYQQKSNGKYSLTKSHVSSLFSLQRDSNPSCEYYTMPRITLLCVHWALARTWTWPLGISFANHFAGTTLLLVLLLALFLLALVFFLTDSSAFFFDLTLIFAAESFGFEFVPVALEIFESEKQPC